MNRSFESLVRRGATVYPDARGKVVRLPRGPVLAYRALPQTLWQIEDHRGPSAIAAVGITGPAHFRDSFTSTASSGAQPWVSAYNPEHLGGPEIEAKSPVVSDPVIWEALKTFTNLINSSTGLSHSSDRSSVTEGLMKLKAAGHHFCPDDLLAGALRLNWKGNAAVELRELALEINAGKQKQFRKMLRADIVELWRTEASAATPPDH